jgi:hypothetical protein
MLIPHSPTPYLSIYKSDGTPVDSGKLGAALVSGATYYALVGVDAAHIIEAMLQWDAAIIITSVEVETTNNPDALNYSTTVGEWVKRNTVGALGLLEASSGTVTALTLSAIAGGTAGGATWTLRNGALKTRLKIVVAGTGGRVIATGNGKA